MTRQNLRILIIGLLLVTGIFHLATALLGTAPGLGIPLTVFGIIYVALSFFVRADVKDGSKSGSRNAIIATMIACTVGLTLGGSNYISDGGPMALPIMFVIDVVIIGAGAMWLMKAPKKS